MNYNSLLGTITLNNTEYPVTTGFIVILLVKHLADILVFHYYTTGATLAELSGPVIAAIFVNLMTIIEYKRDFDLYHSDTDTLPKSPYFNSQNQ